MQKKENRNEEKYLLVLLNLLALLKKANKRFIQKNARRQTIDQSRLAKDIFYE
jgi:hypothetical protein